MATTGRSPPIAIPAALVTKIKNAATFNQGFQTTEYLGSALMDMKYHTVDPAGIDPVAFERSTLEALGMPDEIVMRHRTPHFNHIFSGEGYATGYYSYDLGTWSFDASGDFALVVGTEQGGADDVGVIHRLDDAAWRAAEKK